jgi:multidrug efflux pump subunit AcrA (membrane-fusion protein)
MTIHYLRTLFVAVLTLSLSGCARQSESADRVQPDPIAVRVSTPKHIRVPAEVVVSGTVETPSEPTNVGFLVSGKVIHVGPREGDFVKAGEVLAVVDPADYQFAVEAAIAQSALARAQNEKASVSARPEVVEQARANLSQAEEGPERFSTERLESFGREPVTSAPSSCPAGSTAYSGCSASSHIRQS